MEQSGYANLARPTRGDVRAFPHEGEGWVN